MQATKKPKVQSREVTYELYSLGWKAFQDLCVTIVSEVWGQVIQSFFDSYDGGRDGAFHGTWKTIQGESFNGAFTVQCKFVGKVDKTINLYDLKDEVEKAKRLASRGLANNYILFTNARLTGVAVEKMQQAFEAISGINHFAAYGCDRISQFIRESSRLRMLVPRVYGLGDLSQILDERAYSQAQEILSALGDDLGKFVITEAYKKSAKALVEHSFVLLLGEPACGKSTIAAALAVGALDQWGCSTVKVCDADDFKTHWNPNEPKQFFWVDDAFGTTQIDWSMTYGWNRLFPHIQAAIKKGSRVLFTSRDYIYRAAKDHLKESALPIMKGSQIVINVQDITEQERKQILYNHIKKGTQHKKFKSEIKPYLSATAIIPQFSPEIARRLGDPLFTKKLSISKWGLKNFVEHPSELLLDIIRALDADSRSAIALVFMRAGVLPSPIDISTNEQQAITLLGGSIKAIRSSFHAMNGSLLAQRFENGRYTWHYKHPTIQDAFATLVSEDSELMDIYLTGVSLDKLFNEISCGDVGIEGVKVIVPLDRYEALITRIESFDTTKWHNDLILKRFFSYRCDGAFIENFIARNPQFIPNLKTKSSFYLSDFDVIARIHSFGLLPNTERLRAVDSIRRIAIEVPDSKFLRSNIRGLMSCDELLEILEQVKSLLIPNLDEKIDQLRDVYNNAEDDPEQYFDDLKSTLEDYRYEFDENEGIAKQIDKALAKIETIIEQLQFELPQEPNREDSFGSKLKEDSQDLKRSIFDDVDI